VPVLPGDDAEALAARVLAQEHRIYPLAIRWFAEGRLRLNGGRVWLDGEPLGPGGHECSPEAAEATVP
jgi:phosphoribosylglycinamide formyltransferase-1